MPPAPARFLAFTDGSSLANPGGPGGTGFVVVDRSRGALRFGGTRWTADGAAGVTNNRMELRSVLEALEGLPDGEEVEVHSDSRYVVDALSRWIHGWRRKGWRTASGEPVMNRDLIEALAARQESLRVRWSWVRGHAGHPVNEICDALAQSAARGVPGPARDEVVAALRAQGLLAPVASRPPPSRQPAPRKQPVPREEPVPGGQLSMPFGPARG
jgi:ribonuclease HI